MRLDLFLSENGYAQSRQRAKSMIEGGEVEIDGVVVKKPSFAVSDGEHTVKVRDPLIYVSRGGLKLEAALDAFSVDPTGLCALDIGASTGGFTDCLLQRGASKVYAVDAGEKQLAKKLCEDERVISFEHMNARSMTVADIGSTVDLAVMDVSFISATYIIPRIPALLGGEGTLIALIKPQFEVGRAMLGKGGIVKDPAAHLAAILRVFECAEQYGFSMTGLIVSPIEGGDGNREFLACFRLGGDFIARTPQEVRAFLKGI